jgi:hypothetical protein
MQLLLNVSYIPSTEPGEEGYDIIDVIGMKNHKGMTPAHMAMTGIHPRHSVMECTFSS